MKLQKLGVQQSHLHNEQKQLELLIDLKRGVQRLLNELLRQMQHPSREQDLDALIPKVRKLLRHLLALARDPTSPTKDAPQSMAHLRKRIAGINASNNDVQLTQNELIEVYLTNKMSIQIVTKNDRL